MNIDVWHIDGRNFHFGRHGLGQEETSTHFPSDSLFAAITARYALLFGADQTTGWLEPFLGEKPPFVLTTAFPQAGGVRFYPPPKGTIGKETKDLPLKKLKKVTYVSEGLFVKLLHGETIAGLWNSAKLLHDEKVLLTEEEWGVLPESLRLGREPMWQVSRRAQVTIDRALQLSTLYHTGTITFNLDCGLWFGVHWVEETPRLKDQFAMLMEDLGYAGLGGERSRGYGACTILQAGRLDLPDPVDHWVTLSRYLPKDKELAALKAPYASYELNAVGGWVNSPSGGRAERRKTLNFLQEGSVFGQVPAIPPGRLEDAKPTYGTTEAIPHPVWRNGFALAVGIQRS